MNNIASTLVYGFPDAGKTSYIRDCILNGFFHRRGTTLILCFEQGEEQYDEAALAEKKTTVAFYDGGDVKAFCEDAINTLSPDRIYVEMNTWMPELKDQLPECMKVAFAITLIEWDTFQPHYVSHIQQIREMVSESNQVTFRGCPQRRMLEPYSQAFRVMNPKAAYLRQDPMGYHEKAFDIFVPFSLEADEIPIDEKNYLPFWLDAFDHPEHYNGKTIRFTEPVEIRKSDADGTLSCGRVVMTCCMADLQFMSFELDAAQSSGADAPGGQAEGWVTFDALAETAENRFGQKKLRLKAGAIRPAQAPQQLIMDSRRR